MANNKRIPVGELTAYERWELPNIDGGNVPTPAESAVSKTPKIKPLTADDIEKIRQEAYQVGFEEGKEAGLESGKAEGLEIGKQTGHQQGLAQGLQEGQAKIDATVAQLTQVLSALSSPIAEQEQFIQQAIVNISLALSRSVIHRELSLDSSSVTKAVEGILLSLPKMSTGIRVSVSPVDEILVKQAISAIDTDIDVVSKSDLQAGGCLVETSSQLMDYTIEKRFQKAVHEMLLNATQPGESGAIVETSSRIDEASEYPAELLEKTEKELLTEKELITEKESPSKSQKEQADQQEDEQNASDARHSPESDSDS